MNTPFALTTWVTRTEDGALGLIVGTGVVHDGDREVPTASILMPEGRITVRGNGFYSFEAA